MVNPQKMSSTQIKTGTCCLNCGIAINDHTLSSWIHTFSAVAVLKVKKQTNPGTYNNDNNFLKNAVVFCFKAI